jgi:benzoyl-CoA-dihydrodiol lyase
MAAVTRHQPIASFQTSPEHYRHWKLTVDGAIASLVMDIQEGNGLRPDDYELKQNSYDLGVDIELNDAVERLRFEHPEVRVVVVSSALPKVFCAGANIRMLATSTHGFKVNFCRYTNETRLGIEDASAHSGLRFLCAANGTAAGGGYELALACDQIALVDDGNAAVSLPEVPLLGVLPGTGGLTRLVDKRKVRHDLADLFCTKAEGFRARDAVRYGLVDASFSRSRWDAGVAQTAADLAATSPARASKGVALTPLVSTVEGRVRSWNFVTLTLDAEERVATLVIRGPDRAAPTSVEGLRAEGTDVWSMRVFREIEDALFHLRFNHDTVGLVLVETVGDPERVLAHDKVVLGHFEDWFANEIRLYQARVLRRLDNTAKSMFAIIRPGSCFVGSLFEIALAADRSYMLADDAEANLVHPTRAASGGSYPMGTGITRLQARFAREPLHVESVLAEEGPRNAEEALEAGLVTLAPDEIDWEDELRIAVEERISLSPDALTGMEQNLRFVGRETFETKIFGRLSAWQNWIFQRPNAVGDSGALTLYGHPTRPKFDFRRT